MAYILAAVCWEFLPKVLNSALMECIILPLESIAVKVIVNFILYLLNNKVGDVKIYNM